MKNLLILFLFLTSSLYALNSNLSIGDSEGWDWIETWNNTELFDGKGDHKNLGLKSAEYKTDEFTDLLIHFDNTSVSDETGNYTIESQIENTQNEKLIGNASGVFRGLKEPLTLYPGPEALFSGNSYPDSFSIEFWLNPSRFGENPILLSYRGTIRDKNSNLIPQELICSLKDRKLNWNLNNFFYTEESNSYIELAGITSIIPNTWHHHLLRFDSSSGLIEYLLDGQLEAIQYASKTGTEDGTIFSPLISSTGIPHLTLGNNFIGYMDELRISKAFIQNPVLTRYQETKGNAVSEIIDLGRLGSKLRNISIEHEIPGDSAIFFYYNISNNLGTMFDETNWREFYPGEMFISHNKGRYLKIKIDIRTDGEEILTPSIAHLNITYKKNLQPLAPSYLNVTGKNHSISLSWPKLSEPDIEGYLIYYGTKKGNYYGSEAVEGASPLIVKGHEINALDITGLENGKLYYFAIAAYDDAGFNYPGKLSTEITCRPIPSGDN
ncbi:MAG: fibronectin type III domain-containing protein [Spirochaetia bacterium]|jgi:hypothetical protein|nr:fibronectin type III domain-containing protein [Spirochaetia bacterium]